MFRRINLYLKALLQSLTQFPVAYSTCARTIRIWFNLAFDAKVHRNITELKMFIRARSIFSGQLYQQRLNGTPDFLQCGTAVIYATHLSMSYLTSQDNTNELSATQKININLLYKKIQYTLKQLTLNFTDIQNKI